MGENGYDDGNGNGLAQVSETFRRLGFNFLRVRSSPSDTGDVLYNIPNKYFPQTVLIIATQAGRGHPDFFEVDEVRFPDGTMGESGWVMKEFNGVTTLSPVDDPREDALEKFWFIARRRSLTEKLCDYAVEQLSNTANRILAFSNGVICWRPARTSTYSFPHGRHQIYVRVIERLFVLANRGHGLGIVRTMESVVAPDPSDSCQNSLFFLHSLPGARQAHRNHGFSDLWVHNNLFLMYRQLSYAREPFFLAQHQIEYIARHLGMGHTE